jgi:TadE-like protein
MSVMDRRPPTLTNIACDERGAVLVEVSIVMTIMLVFLLGAVEFLFVFYQRSAAAKAVQIGVRIAAVSEPIARGLSGLSTEVLGPRVAQGGAMPEFVVACDGSASRCTCMSGACPSDLAYNAAAMSTIVFGRGSASCGDAKSFYDTGMCDIFARITPANVVITYAQSGLGFAGRPGGPVPTITISLKDLRLQFYFLRGLAGFDDLQMPPLTTSMTAEDLSSSAPAF